MRAGFDATSEELDLLEGFLDVIGSNCDGPMPIASILLVDLGALARGMGPAFALANVAVVAAHRSAPELPVDLAGVAEVFEGADGERRSDVLKQNDTADMAMLALGIKQEIGVLW